MDVSSDRSAVVAGTLPGKWKGYFVDAGLPSTVCNETVYQTALSSILSHAAESNPDVMVAEAGASPLEPYRGDMAVAQLRDNIRCTVLCASDPYAVSGIIHAYGKQPDIVSGAAANTQAAIDLVHKLTGLTAVNLLDQESLWRVRDLLRAALEEHVTGLETAVAS